MTSAPTAFRYVLPDIPEKNLQKYRSEGLQRIREQFKQPTPADVEYMNVIAAQHALANAVPKTYQLYGISVPDGHVLVPDSIRPILSNVSLDPDSFDLRQISYKKDGKYVTTRHYSYLVHVKYQTRFSYEVQKDSAKTRQETKETHDMVTHHYLFPRQALATLVELLKLENDDLVVINGDTYANPLKQPAR